MVGFKRTIATLSALCFASAFALNAYAASAPSDEPAELSEEDAAKAAEIAKNNEIYMKTIVPVNFPAVPFGWNVVISNNTVNYIHSTGTKSKAPNPDATQIKMRYTRNTSGMDAATYMDNYVINHSCEPKTKQGTGFFTTSCITNNTYAIVIGEPNNMYIIELIGDYTAAARAIIENYVGAIVNGKKVFADRNIGDLNTRDK